MADLARRKDSANASVSSSPYPPVTRPDLLLMRAEVRRLWEISEWELAKQIRDHPNMRVQRPGYQPYYPLRAVVEAMGPPPKERLLMMKTDEEIIETAVKYLLERLSDNSVDPGVAARGGSPTPRYRRGFELGELAA